MKKIIWIVVGIALVALMFFKLAANKKTSSDSVYIHDKDKPVTVEVETVRLLPSVENIAYSGIFEPNKETKVTADIQGKIQSVWVDVGSFVSKGQPLIQLDNELLKLQLRSIEIQIEGLKDDEKRYTILADADAVQGVQLEKTRLALKSANIQKATLTEQINRSIIRAPFAGIVTAKLNEAGGFAAPGAPLLQITDISSLRFTVNAAEDELKKFRMDKSYSISSDAFPDIRLAGKLIMIGSKANVVNSFPVQFMVRDTRNSGIRSGMFGKVNVHVDNDETGFIIPTSSILRDAGTARVYVVQNGRAVLTSIVETKNTGNKTIVRSGLNEGDKVVVNGVINLYDGANVSVKN